VLRSYIERGPAVASITSRQFNHDVGAAKRAAQTEPVVITDRGEPAYVLMTFEEYRRLRPTQRSLYDVLRFDGDVDIEWEPGRLNFVAKVPDFDDES